jgi:hypothetical protein
MKAPVLLFDLSELIPLQLLTRKANPCGNSIRSLEDQEKWQGGLLHRSDHMNADAGAQI